MERAGAVARRGKGGDQFRWQLRDANARGGARRASRRAVGSRRLHAGSRRPGRHAGDRRGDDELRHLPAGAAAPAGDATATAGSGARGARPRCACHRKDPGAAVGGQPRAPSPQFLAQTVDMLERATLRPSTPLYPRVSAQLRSTLEATLTGRLGAAAAARRTAELIGAITGLPVLHEVDPASATAAVAS